MARRANAPMDSLRSAAVMRKRRYVAGVSLAMTAVGCVAVVDADAFVGVLRVLVLACAM